MARDNRKKNRLDVDQAVPVFNLHTDETMGHIVNITEHGFLLLSDFPIKQNKIFQFRFLIGEDPRNIELGADSLWGELTMEPEKYWTGFSIIDISEENQQRLFSFIREL